MIETHKEDLKLFDEISFDIFELCKNVERHNVMPLMTVKALHSLKL